MSVQTFLASQWERMGVNIPASVRLQRRVTGPERDYKPHVQLIQRKSRRTHHWQATEMVVLGHGLRANRVGLESFLALFLGDNLHHALVEFVESGGGQAFSSLSDALT